MFCAGTFFALTNSEFLFLNLNPELLSVQKFEIEAGKIQGERMFKFKLTSILATAMILSVGHSIYADEPSDLTETHSHLLQTASNLCGHGGEITYLQCITEDGSRLDADPSFFALIKKLCGADTQIKKCLKDMLSGTGSEPNLPSVSQEGCVPSSNGAPTSDKNQPDNKEAESNDVPSKNLVSAASEPAAFEPVLTLSPRLQASEDISETISASLSNPVLVASGNKIKPKTKKFPDLPAITFAQPKKPKKKGQSYPSFSSIPSGKSSDKSAGYTLAPSKDK